MLTLFPIRPRHFRAVARRAGFSCLLALAMVTPAGAAGPSLRYAWRNVTVGGGGFAPGIVFSTAERGLAYLRTDMGGAYRRDARADRWIPLQDGMAIGSYMGIESVAPDPVDAEVVYLAAGMGARAPAAILRSADRGGHWRVTPVSFAMGGNEDGRGLGERLAVDPHKRATLFFGSRHDGLWRSDDSGARWRRVSAFPLAGLGQPTEPRKTHGGLSFVLFDPAQAGRMFVGNADPGDRHLFRSDDGGQSWRAVPGGPAADMVPVKAVVGGDGVLTISYADAIGPNGVTRGAVWRHAIATGAWTDVTPDRRADAPPGGYFGVAVSRQDPRVIAVSTVNRYNPIDTVWRSVDGGAHWDELYRRSIRDVTASPFLKLNGEEADFGHWIAGLGIDPFDDRHAAYTTGATLYDTRDFAAPGRMTWRPWTRGIEQTAIITLTSPTGGAPLVSGFGDIAGFRHDNLTVSPPHVHRNPYLTNTNTLDYAGLAPSVMVRSGSTHTKIVPGPSLAWSADGGGSWQPLVPREIAPVRPLEGPAPIATGDAPIIVSADGRTFLAGTIMPMLTRDRGASWVEAIGLPLRSRPAADKVDPRLFYVVDAEAGRFLRSEDGGAHFTVVAARGLPRDLSSARNTWREAQNPLVATPGRAGALWLLIDGTLYRSEDRGDSWVRVPGALKIGYYGLGKAATGSGWPALYAIGEREGVKAVWRSIDGGTDWARINDDAHQWGMRFRVIGGDPKRYGRVYIGTDGRGIVYGDPR
ncbi:WD40/YVTN/BNR-like repeat-containing protein [Sphingomonas arantia]|uniref:WD40/YVTN/BNR-like repeat-containing protein n=2 Tax=Sphingomonas arantia TaxID=1460676 RepID=A0ABW4TYI5_9SPHN